MTLGNQTKTQTWSCRARHETCLFLCPPLAVTTKNILFTLIIFNKQLGRAVMRHQTSGGDIHSAVGLMCS